MAEKQIFFIDTPGIIRAGDLAVRVKGWYAGTIPCDSLSFEAGRESAPCILEDRPDVVAAYPGLHTRGFRCILDCLQAGWHVGYAGGVLNLRICLNGGHGSELELRADEDWFRQVEARNQARQRGLLPNGLPDTGAESLGMGLSSGAEHYRAYVGLPEHHDLSAAGAFCLLVLLGLRQHHMLVDVGCGSLRCGKLFIPYLNAGNYIGIEPNRWLVEEGIRRELGGEIVAAKSPRFLFSASASIPGDGGPADFALANSIFSHAARHQIAEWLEALSHALSPAGILAATFLVGPEDYEGTTWVYPGCVRYRLETMRQLAGQFGFTLHMLPWRHLHGQSWAVFAKPKFDPARLAGDALSWNNMVDTCA